MQHLSFKNSTPFFAASLLIGLISMGNPAMSASEQQTRPASASDVSVPLSDARKIEPNSIRFSAAQFTTKAPTLVLFGGSDAIWSKVRSAIQQAVFDGYPVEMVFIGPITAPPGIEIYAKGHHVTNPINPASISATELTKLLRDVNREYYGR